MTTEELKEELAAREHLRWGHWQKWMHSKCTLGDDGLVIPNELVDRWERQIATPYEELSDLEKQSDRDQVDRYWPLIQNAIGDAYAAGARLSHETANQDGFDPDNMGERIASPLEGPRVFYDDLGLLTITTRRHAFTNAPDGFRTEMRLVDRGLWKVVGKAASSVPSPDEETALGVHEGMVTEYRAVLLKAINGGS